MHILCYPSNHQTHIMTKCRTYANLKIRVKRPEIYTNVSDNNNTSTNWAYNII